MKTCDAPKLVHAVCYNSFAGESAINNLRRTVMDSRSIYNEMDRVKREMEDNRRRIDSEKRNIENYSRQKERLLQQIRDLERNMQPY